MAVLLVGRAGNFLIVAAVLAACAANAARAAAAVTLAGPSDVDQAVSGTYTVGTDSSPLVGDANVSNFDPGTVEHVNNVLKYTIETSPDWIGQSHVYFNTSEIDGAVLAQAEAITYSNLTLSADSSIDMITSAHAAYASCVTLDTALPVAVINISVGTLILADTPDGATITSDAPTAAASVVLRITDVDNNEILPSTPYTSDTTLTGYSFAPGTKIWMTFDVDAYQHLAASVGAGPDVGVGWTVGSAASVSVVPEPASMGLLVLGAMALLRRRK